MLRECVAVHRTMSTTRITIFNTPIHIVKGTSFITLGGSVDFTKTFPQLTSGYLYGSQWGEIYFCDISSILVGLK